VSSWKLTDAMILMSVVWLPRRWHASTKRHFTHNPLSGKSYTLLTSMFRSVLSLVLTITSPVLKSRFQSQVYLSPQHCMLCFGNTWYVCAMNRLSVSHCYSQAQLLLSYSETHRVECLMLHRNLLLGTISQPFSSQVIRFVESSIGII
jgi:hypothetical protein